MIDYKTKKLISSKNHEFNHLVSSLRGFWVYSHVNKHIRLNKKKKNKLFVFTLKTKYL